MRKIIYILLALGALVGCRSKKVTSEARKVTSEAVGVRVTDSITEEQQRGEVHTFELRQAHSYELTLEGDSLEVKSEKRIVKNDKGAQAYIEVLKVNGGKAVIKMKQEARQEAHAVETVEAHKQMKQVREAKEERMETATIQREEQRAGRGLAWWISGLALVVVLWFAYKIVRRWVG
jgi:lipoprotein